MKRILIPKPFNKEAQEEVADDFYCPQARAVARLHTRRFSNSGFTHAKKGILRCTPHLFSKKRR